MTALSGDKYELYRAIAAPWLAAEGDAGFDVHESATGRLLGTFRSSSPADVDRAVMIARQALPEWRKTTARERAALMKQAAQILRDAADELAAIETQEVGKPIEISRNYDLVVCAESFEYFGSLIMGEHGEFFPGGPIDTYTMQEPYGVIAGVIPFNWPPIHTSAKIAPSLAMGNVIIVKPPEQCPLAVLRIVQLLAEIFPPGVVQAVAGTGAEVGAALVSHPGIDRVSFTGSPESGKAVLRAMAENLTGALLELGGKNPLIVFPDADLDAAVRGAIEGTFFNQGEACTSASRILVHHDVSEEFAERYIAAASRLVIGDGLDPRTHIGPMVTEAHRQRVVEYLTIGQEDGATLAYAGQAPTDPRLAGGYFVAPAVFTGVTTKMRIAQEEIFGPVAAIMPFGTYDEAMEIANSTRFALVASVYTRDDVLARRASRDIDAGVVFINNFNRMFLGTPFGGNRASGYGREHAAETLKEFSRTKSIRVVSGSVPLPEWSGATT